MIERRSRLQNGAPYRITRRCAPRPFGVALEGRSPPLRGVVEPVASLGDCFHHFVMPLVYNSSHSLGSQFYSEQILYVSTDAAGLQNPLNQSTCCAFPRHPFGVIRDETTCEVYKTAKLAIRWCSPT